MPTHAEKREMPYSAEQMFALIADVPSYPEFLPWCAAAGGRSRTETDAVAVMDADLVIAFKLFRERFGSRVELRPDLNEIDVSYLDGPFKYLVNNWKFIPIDEDRCEVDFFVDFEFKSATMQMIIGVVFGEAMRMIVRAFERRAKELYG